MVQVGAFHVHKSIYSGYFYPPRPEDYMGITRGLRPGRIALLVIGLLLVGIGIGLVLPV